eukprot:TRINITY_DN4318_c0_g5_i1.p2 TRINITY_DN4318_c0_g5~~TRINITY_DN4318_c0_g5_i1.p2  ORF type:complete len:129 (-),score=28.12 TRINITY_DN4318_c0_g5_i1:568-954(-)
MKAVHNVKINLKGVRRMVSYAKESTKLNLIEAQPKTINKEKLNKSTLKSFYQNDSAVLSVIENVKSNENRLNKYMKYLNKKARIFEEFFMIGVDVQTIEASCIDMKGKISMEPKVLFQYPNLEKNKNW